MISSAENPRLDIAAKKKALCAAQLLHENNATGVGYLRSYLKTVTRGINLPPLCVTTHISRGWSLGGLHGSRHIPAQLHITVKEERKGRQADGGASQIETLQFGVRKLTSSLFAPGLSLTAIGAFCRWRH